MASPPDTAPPATGHRDDGADTPPPTVVIPAELPPSDAAAIKAGLLAGLVGTACAIEIDEDRPSPTALQLLVAARRMAERDGISVRFGDRAKAAIARLGASEKIGERDR